MDIVACQPIWFGDQHAIKFSGTGSITQAIQPWSIKIGTAAAVIAKDMVIV
jgi:hypothetical protein